MQVPLIDRLSDFKAGFNSLQNPSTSFPSQITTSIQSVSIAYNLCKWGAVILALVATFGSIINRVTIFIIRFRNKAPSLPSISFDDDDDYSTGDDSENDIVVSYSSSSEFEDLVNTLYFKSGSAAGYLYIVTYNVPAVSFK